MFQMRDLLRGLPAALAVKLCLDLSILIASLLPTIGVAYARPVEKAVAGRRAIVVDERLSALREKPEMSARLVQRLRRGRLVGITGAVRGRDGERFYSVFVTRRTRGWILAEALARSGSESDAQRLLLMIETEGDGFAKVKLATICAREFRRTGTAAKAYLTLGESADRVASELTTVARRRLRRETGPVEKFMLNDVGLDRYNRLGVYFRFADGERLVYDGAAYRELLRRYPRTPEAMTAKERLNAR